MDIDVFAAPLQYSFQNTLLNITVSDEVELPNLRN